MKKTLAELASLTGSEIIGDSECELHGINTLQLAQFGELSFLHNPSYKKYLSQTKASAVIIAPDMKDACETNALISKDPYFTYAQVAKLFEYTESPAKGIHPSAVIGENCDIHPEASIAANVVIAHDVSIGRGTVIEPGVSVAAHTKIGEDCHLHANVSVYHHSVIGNRVMLHSGVVIGSDGFGNAMHEGQWHRVPQIGNVVIEDDVNIGANTTVDRGAIGDTKICQGVRLDNLIQVGHNVEIGAHTAIAAQTAIAGSVKIGAYCMIGGGSCINGHLEIADRTIITGMSGVGHTITEPGGVYSSGMPATPNKLWRRNIIRLTQLDKIAKQVKYLTNQISKIKQEEEL